MQEFALELLLIAEQRDKANSFLDDLKLALVSAEPRYFLQKLFPTWFVEKKQEVEADDDLENIQGEIEFEEEMDPREAERFMQEMLAQGGGELSLEDLE